MHVHHERTLKSVENINETAQPVRGGGAFWYFYFGSEQEAD